MLQKPTLILASGGLRSLVATAALASAQERARLIFLHLKDGRANAAVRLDHLRRLAEHYRVADMIELELPHLRIAEAVADHNAQRGSPLVRPQVLLTALAQAVEIGAGRVIWPAQVDGDYDTIARVTEEVVLVQHLAQLEHAALPLIETPLLELTDVQVVELGGQLEAPWALAWTCLLTGERPCRLCEACRRRRSAFEAAGVVDPTDPTARKPSAVS
jgi:7-cyano-7-deazaguanine synthase